MSTKKTKPLAHGTKYSKKDVMDLYGTFSVFDVNGDGKVNAAEMVERIKNREIKMPMSHLNFIRVLDVNHDGVLTFDEVLERYYPYATQKELKTMYRWAFPDAHKEHANEHSYELSEAQIKELKAMFSLYDKNGSGSLERQELQEVAKTAGYDPEEVDALFEYADINHDEVISFDEFVELMRFSYIS